MGSGVEAEQGPLTHHFQAGALGVHVRQVVEHHVGHEARRPHPQPWEHHRVRRPPAVGTPEDGAEPRRGVDHALSPVRETPPRKLRESRGDGNREPPHFGRHSMFWALFRVFSGVPPQSVTGKRSLLRSSFARTASRRSIPRTSASLIK